jgi:P27 family predicted phage terminase small subunit
LLHGNPSKLPASKLAGGLRLPAKAPRCPAHLRGEERREFLRLARLLGAQGVLCAVDRGPLSVLCSLWGRYVEAEIALAALDADDPATERLRLLLMKISRDACRLMLPLAIEFGLTPKARGGVFANPPKPNETSGGWSQFS